MQRVGVVALDPETMPTPNWRFGKGAKRLSQRQRRRRSLEDDGAERALHRGFEPEYLEVDMLDAARRQPLTGGLGRS